MKKVIYTEEQKGRSMGIFFLLLVVLVLAISRMINDFWIKTETAENFPLWTYGLVIGSLVVGIIYFWKVRLTIKVGEKSIKAKFFPCLLGKRKIKLEEIDHFTIMDPQLLSKVTGWRIRWSGEEESYALKSKAGIWLDLKDGQKIFIGTQKPEIIRQALDRAGVVCG
jgi:uncharacterized membrane protein YciS (DUF1049 family)